MTTYELISRPPKVTRGQQHDDTDAYLEMQLLSTLKTDKALKVPLVVFHTSPSKRRLWGRGYRVLHRVLPDKETVAAWVEYDPRHAVGQQAEVENAA